jgi:hypothetical protein
MNKELKKSLYKAVTPIIVIIVAVCIIFIAYKIASPYERCLRWYQKVPDWYVMESKYFSHCANDHSW